MTITPNHEAAYVADGMYVCQACGYGLTIDQLSGPCETPTTPAERRSMRLGVVFNTWYPKVCNQPGGTVLDDNTVTAIAAAIRDLAQYGRSPKWVKAVEGYARLVETERNPWAVAQGMIWLNHAN